MVGTTFSIRRVANAGFEDLGFHFDGASEGGIEVLELKPKDDAVAVGFEIWIAERAMVVLDFPAVELENEGAIVNEAFVFRTAVIAFQAKEALIPAAGGFDVGRADEGLGMQKGFGEFDYPPGENVTAFISAELEAPRTTLHFTSCILSR